MARTLRIERAGGRYHVTARGNERKCSSDFWDVLAPHHAAVENSYFDLPSLRSIVSSITEPVLVVGAGQGLIVAELRKRGFRSDGVDLSPEMIRYAKLRRGLTLVKANAKAMPFGEETYATILYATGVLDFMLDEEEIRAILKEGRRIVKSAGKIFIAFYRLSRASEDYLEQMGLLTNSIVSLRKSMEMYRLNPLQMLAWVAKRKRVGYFRAMTIMLRVTALSTNQERAVTFRMQKIFRNPDNATALINAAPEKQPYRNEAEIRNLFKLLDIPLKQVKALNSCWIVQI